MSSASVALRDVSFSYGPKLVLSQVSFTLGPHTRMGVVGPNGTGKSTLLQLVAGVLPPESGTIVRSPASALLGHLTQEPGHRDGETLAAFLRRRSGVQAVEDELDAAAAALVEATPEAADRYDAALAQYTSSGAADYDSRAPEVIARVGLDEIDGELPVAAMSGGQKARASLASILLSRFDLLLLDEPTNDLDFAGLALLESFVNGNDRGMLIVSHDRTFLERTTNAILELDPHKHTATTYNGGWLAYQQERATARALAEQRYGEYETTRSTLLSRAQTQRSWGDKTTKSSDRKDNDKLQRNFTNEKTEKMAGKARQTAKALERLETVEKPFEGWVLQMQLETAERSGTMVTALTGAEISVGDFQLGPVTVEVSFGDRIAIVGRNGEGKTTLLRALLGRLPLTAGEHRFGSSVVLGELDQLRDVLSGDTPLLDVFIEQSGLLAGDARTLMAKFGLTADHVLRPGRELSPGERTRAMLALLMARKTNLLVLDEPTNHLDLEAIEQLEQALETYDGTVLLITHDRRMLESVRVTRTLQVSSGQVTELS